MRIYIYEENETLRYAAEELLKYATMMTDGLEAEIAVDPNGKGGIMLGLTYKLGLPEEEVKDRMIDDLIDVSVDKLTGYIAGSNERSVLMGVYNYLRSAGCRWVRPGDAGEYIPKADLREHSFSMRKLADYPFRGQCCEGAISYEHMRDTILWMPKVNMNLFMLEQIVPYNYMNRWYRHTVNTRLPHDDIPYSDYVEYCERIELLVKKLGLQLHVLGHGAILEPFGVRHMISGQHYDIPEEVKYAFAKVGGKRELFMSSPFFTQVCMANEKVREHIVNWLADYLDKKPHIDFLHFWLADASNNQCECEECVKRHPSDFYVMMLNRLDEILTERKNNTKIVFITYVDTLWPPIEEKLHNPSRFILTAACGTGKGYSAKRREGGIPKWERNHFHIPGGGGLDMSLTFIDGWKRAFDGPKFIYEYYLYTAHFADPGYMLFSRQMARDIKTLSVTGFNGIMSDQTQRSFFPTGLPATIVGEYLFDTEIETESYIDKYLKDSFGEDYKTAKEYLERISASFDPEAMRQNTDITAQDTGSMDTNSHAAGIIGNERAGDDIKATAEIVESYREAIKDGMNLADKCHKESWRILSYHTEYVKRLSEIYYALSRNDIDGARAHLETMTDWLSEIELEIHPYFDLVLWRQRTSQIIAGK